MLEDDGSEEFIQKQNEQTNFWKQSILKTNLGLQFLSYLSYLQFSQQTKAKDKVCSTHALRINSN